MLSQIQFKLNVEEQYLKGIEKMVQLYQMEGDKKSKADAAARRIESSQKIVLLKQALKRYEELHIDMDADSPDGMPSKEPYIGRPSTDSDCHRRQHQHAELEKAPDGPALGPYLVRQRCGPCSPEPLFPCP